MINNSDLRRRFMQDDLPRRLGNLSSSLARLSDFVEFQRSPSSVTAILGEAAQFANWSLVELDDERQADLQELSQQLQVWLDGWPGFSSDSDRTTCMASEARLWSNRILEISGLLSPTGN